MKKHTVFVIFLFVSVVLIFSMCAKEPVDELQLAEKAMLTAGNSDAPQWAPDAYKVAKEKLNKGKTLIAEKNYKEAGPALNEAAKLADVARREAIRAKKITEEQANEEVRKLEQERVERELAKKRELEQKKLEAEKQKRIEEEKKKNAQRYVVKNGDCLWKIAKKLYGEPLMWTIIYEANKKTLKSPHLIKPGQTLIIPPQKTLKEQLKENKYMVKRGDSLWKISKTIYDNPLMWKQIYAANSQKIDDAAVIFPVSVLTIPKITNKP